MRSNCVGFVFGTVIALIVAVVASQNDNVHAQRPYVGAGDIEVFQSDEGHQLTVVDRQHRVMAVYGIDSKTQEVTLRSVRNFRWDLQLDEYNGKEPQPKQIRALIDKSR